MNKNIKHLTTKGECLAYEVLVPSQAQEAAKFDCNGPKSTHSEGNTSKMT